MAHFTEYTHPHWNRNYYRWIYSHDQYTGDYAEHDKIKRYLQKKSRSETDEMYDERCKTSDIRLDFATAIDGLNGIMFAKEKDTARSFGLLGDVDEVGSIAHRLNDNADGEGTNWNAVFKGASIKASIYNEVWCLVEGIGAKEEDAKVHIIEPQYVVNYYPSVGKMEKVLVKEVRDARDSLESEPRETDVFIEYSIDGWRRYKAGAIIESGTYEYWATGEKKERILPIFRTKLPMPRDVGYLLARRQNALFNMFSARDNAIRDMAFAFLGIVADENQFDDVIEKWKESGMRVLRTEPGTSNHYFFSPDAGYLSEFNNILQKSVEDFYINAFKEYGNAASQKTATEVRLESRTGIEAFLALLVGAVDDIENNALWRLEQIYFPDSPNQWGEANAVRSRNFQPEDVQKGIEDMARRYFGGNIPAPKKALVNVLWQILRKDNIDIEGITDEDVEEALGMNEPDEEIVDETGVIEEDVQE
jgi:hypothetical protein